MADHYTQGTVVPDVPDVTVPREDLQPLVEQEEVADLLDLHGVDPQLAGLDWKEMWRGLGGAWELTPEGQVYLYFEDSCHEAMATLLQVLLPHVPFDAFQVEFAHTCSKMAPGQFGGGAWYVTRDQAHWVATADWLHRMATSPSATANPSTSAGSRGAARDAGNEATVPRLDGRELAAVLAGLRLLQKHIVVADVPAAVAPILAGTGRPLDAVELDDLCQRLNLGGAG